MGLCKGLRKEILPGSYTAIVVEPGPSCFEAEANSEFVYAPASVGRTLELNAEPGRTFFIRLDEKPGHLISRAALRLVQPDVADPEIGSCYRLVPLTSDEIYQQIVEGKRR